MNLGDMKNFDDFFKEKGNSPGKNRMEGFGAQPPVPSGVPILGQAKEPVKCPVCGGPLIWMPAGFLTKYELRENQIPLLELTPAILIQIVGNQIMIQCPCPIIFCMGDCKRPYAGSEMAALMKDKKARKSTGEKETPESIGGKEKPESTGGKEQ